MATIKDVAKYAKVSLGTVSRVINGATNIDPLLYERTQDAIKITGYQPNAMAQRLARKKSFDSSRIETHTIGILFYKMSALWLEQPLVLNYLNGIQKIAKEYKYHSLIETVPHEPQGIPSCVEEGRVDGLLLKAPHLDQNFISEISRYCPVVGMNIYMPHLSIPQVVIDNHGAAICVVERLLQMGHRRIAFINSDPGHSMFVARSHGFMTALRQHNLYDPALVIERETSPDQIIDPQSVFPNMDSAVETLMNLNPRPTAVLVSNDWGAAGIYQSLKKRGIKIGQEMSVVGFDDDQPLCNILEPSLSTVAFPFSRVAEIAAKILLEMLQRGKHYKEPLIRLVQGEFKQRDSVSSV